MNSAAIASRRSRPGRPRHIPERDDNVSARDEILGVAARLFVSNGFAGTSTRVIAEEVGIRQASLYYHFAGKDDMLAELLEMTVRPALESLGDLGQGESPEASLYGLALLDAGALAGLMHNIGVLPRLPDIAPSPAAREYAAARQDLVLTYSSLGISCASDVVIGTIDKSQLGELIMQLVESVITARTEGDVVSKGTLRGVAASCLRVCGVPEDRIVAAAQSIP